MIEWPSTIPLPFVDFSGSVRTTTIQSDAPNAAITRRSRYRSRSMSVVVGWVLDPGQFLSFQQMFHTTLEEGTSLFSIDLIYPLNSAVTAWVVRFLGGYDTSYEDGHWVVRADLDLVRPVAVAEAAIPVGYGLFYVIDPDNTGEYLAFSTPGGDPVYVKVI